MAKEREARRVTWWSTRLAARSRRETFTALHRAHAPAVFSISLRLLGNREDAEDVTQDVLLKAYQRLARDGEPQGRAWLYRVTVNACYDRLRARRRRPTVAWQPEFELALPPTLDQKEHAELRRQIEEAFRRVPPAQRAALLLREVHGLRTDELAETLGITAGSVEVTLARARSCFRRQFVAVSQDVTATVAASATRRAEGSGDVDSAVLRSLSALGLGALPPTLGATALLAKGSASAGAAGGGAAAGLLTKLSAAFSAKAAAVALGATAIAGAAAGGLYSAEHAQDQMRHRTASPPVAAAGEARHSSVAGSASRSHPATTVVAVQTAHVTATTSPSPSTPPLVVGESGATPSTSATPTPAPTTTDTATPTPSASPEPSVTPTPTASPLPSPTPSPSATASPSPSPSPTASPSPSPSASP